MQFIKVPLESGALTNVVIPNGHPCLIKLGTILHFHDIFLIRSGRISSIRTQCFARFSHQKSIPLSSVDNNSENSLNCASEVLKGDFPPTDARWARKWNRTIATQREQVYLHLLGELKQREWGWGREREQGCVNDRLCALPRTSYSPSHCPIRTLHTDKH